MTKRIISAVTVFVLLFVMAFGVSALEEPDMSRIGSISIAMTYQGEPVAGGSLTLFRVADVYEQNGADYSFRYTQAYENCQVSLDDLTNSDTALALAEYTKENNIPGTKLQIDQEGMITFTQLELGLYLLVQQDAAPGYELVNPFLVSVPSMKDGSYIYDVDASPKLALEQAPTEPPPPTDPPPPVLPQTGQNQWPIPVLAIGGLLLIVVGLALCAGKKRSHEN